MQTLPTTCGVRDLVFVRPDGTSVMLQAFIGDPLLLVFLRHLA
jgi:hypothetical protein